MVDLKSTIVGGFASLFIRSILTVATVHGLPEHYKDFLKKIKYGVSLSIYYMVLKLLVDRVICVSADLRSRLKKSVKADKIKTIHNGISLKSHAGMTPKLRKKGELVVGTIGRLETVKGYEYLLEAATKVIKKNDSVVFHIIGTGPLEEQLRRHTEMIGLSQRVIFFGFQPHAGELIERMDLFVMSSLHEGIPYALLEAMSCIKPVVCTQVGGIKEVIQDRIDGLLVPPKDPLALSKAILEVLETKEFAQQLAENARKKVETHFSSEFMGKQTYALYSQLMRKGKSRGNYSHRN